jgi:hypothetical protein
LSDADRLEGRVADGNFQPYIHQIQLEHAQKRVEQGMNNLGSLGTSPHGRKSEDADQIVITALKALDLVGGMFEWHFHVRPPSRMT